MHATGSTALATRLLRVHIARQLQNRIAALFSTKLAEVGRFDEPIVGSDYASGQLFLHRIFGYRGVILFSWAAKVYDRDLKKSDQLPASSDSPTANKDDVANAQAEKIGAAAYSGGSEIPCLSQTYYQTLIDSHDWNYSRAQSESVTFLGSSNENALYTIAGLDYVSHEDILPYTAALDASVQPINHELFEKFLIYNPKKANGPPYDIGQTLTAWMVKNRPWLELSDVHRETTENVRVTVIPFYMGARDTVTSTVHWWRYSVRLENLGSERVTLRGRHWRIFSLSGTLETVRGKGVVGKEPILSKHCPAFQYSSHVSIQSPSGHMWGTFEMEREDGSTFECKIPPFTLESKHDGPEEDGTVEV